MSHVELDRFVSPSARRLKARVILNCIITSSLSWKNNAFWWCFVLLISTKVVFELNNQLPNAAVTFFEITWQNLKAFYFISISFSYFQQDRWSEYNISHHFSKVKKSKEITQSSLTIQYRLLSVSTGSLKYVVLFMTRTTLVSISRMWKLPYQTEDTSILS